MTDNPSEPAGLSRRLFVKAAAFATLGAGGVVAASTHGRKPPEPETSPGAKAHAPRGPARNASQAPADDVPWIVRENALPGTQEWRIPPEAIEGDIAGYATVASAQRGDTVPLCVATAAESYRVQAYRMGFYGGAGGRLIWQSPELNGIGQTEPTTDTRTNTVDAFWEPTLELKIDNEWPPGCYLLKLISATGDQHYVPLTIRDDASAAALVIQNSNTTWQAYNRWGGHSLYVGPFERGKDRAVIVSFDRPYEADGAGDFLGIELPAIMLAEQLGLDVTYWTDIDLHARPELVHRHKAIISLGHDEYYSTPMRRGLDAARDGGVNVAFLGANAAYRHIRFEETSSGPHRRMVNYRSTRDPITSVDPSQATVEWRSPPLNDPEKRLCGIQYECAGAEADAVVVQPDHWLFEGTDIGHGTKISRGVGGEYDRVFPGGGTPDNLQLLTHSPLTCNGLRSFSNMSYYSAPSGAGVFASGSIAWVAVVGSHPDVPQDGSVERARKITENLLRVFSAGPAGSRFQSVSNVDQYV